MSSPWSTRREVSPETSRLLIERAHEEFLVGDPADRRLADVRGLVRESWVRSRDNSVGAEGMPPLAWTAEQLEEQRRRHPLAAVIDMIRGLLIPGTADESSVVVAVGDAAGRLLWVEGDRHIRALTSDMGFSPGADWSEPAVGTSAPGTALTLGRSVQIRGAEHYNRHVQPWSCTAAPVHDPETRQLVGVIDVTGGDAVITPQAQLLVDATARAIEGELLVARLRARASAPPHPVRRRSPVTPTTHATLSVLGRDRALLQVAGSGVERVVEVSRRHAELLLMLALHPQGLSAERLGELVYGEGEAPVTLRSELVRLRKMLERIAPELAPTSRPYRLGLPLETDAQHLLSLLDRGAHRVALAAYRGPVLPESVAPGVEQYRDTVATTLRESLLAEASLDVLLAYADTEAGADDDEVLRLCLQMLPARSPRRPGIVVRLERLAAP